MGFVDVPYGYVQAMSNYLRQAAYSEQLCSWYLQQCNNGFNCFRVPRTLNARGRRSQSRNNRRSSSDRINHEPEGYDYHSLRGQGAYFLSYEYVNFLSFLL